MQFTNISQLVFDRLKQEMTTGGVQIHENEIARDMVQSGGIEGHGITSAWRYEPAVETLTLEVTHKPFFIGLGTIAERLNNEIDAIREALAPAVPVGTPPAEPKARKTKSPAST